MNFKKISLGAAALALPLTALGAAPASAATHPDHDHANAPEVAVNVWRHKIKVDYKCDTAGWHDKYGVLKVSFRGDTVRQWVKCDDTYHSAYFKVLGRHGGGKVWAVLIDPDGDKAYDSAYVDGGHH